MISVSHDPDYDLIWMSYRRDPFTPGSLVATTDGQIITVWMRGGHDAILTVDFGQITDGATPPNGFASAIDCVTYLNATFSRRRPLGAQFTQATPLSVWTIPHTLSFQPKVMVIDTAGDPVLTDTRYLTPNVVELRFGVPTTGIAYLS